ncbi:hypothetical protein FB45DRAFT_1030303 [Roridomyces roridus]|uniref:MYND-type domain-containing protein n=1 Tax=Roridomyces roridus TaxID=1738132 RepID=A0AAD7FL14_9AGAR|nr:hypothetical protein FB45DRAFT_1030303 [Roridomyces roridus]
MASSLNALSKLEVPDDLSEFVDGCGGHEALYLTLTSTMDLAARHPTLSSAVALVGGLCLLLDTTMAVVAPDTLPHLLSHGLIPPLVLALGIVGPSSLAHPSGVPFPIVIRTLTSMLCVRPGYPWVEQALRAGLLSQLMFWGSKPGIMQDGPPEVTENFPELLEVVLPQALVFYPIIVEMRKAFANVEWPSSDGELAHSGLYSNWNDLKALLDERSTILEVWESKGRPSSMCCKVSPNRDDFRRCSGCQTAAYCSQACQRADWTEGHRDDCRLHLAARVSSQTGLPHRHCLFLRILLRMDYIRLRMPIAIDMVRFMAENPDTPLLVDFDYTGGAVKVNVWPLSMVDRAAIGMPHSQRLARAGGRLVAHSMRFGCEDFRFDAIWPLWASTSEFYDGLKDIAKIAKGLEGPG